MNKVTSIPVDQESEQITVNSQTNFGPVKSVLVIPAFYLEISPKTLKLQPI